MDLIRVSMYTTFLIKCKWFLSVITGLLIVQIHSVQHTGSRQPVENHCPHGVVGACALCNPAGGGGGGGSVKRNTAGLMTWNEAWSVWNALQVAKTRQADYLKGVQSHQLDLQQQVISANQKSPLMAGLLRLTQFVSPFAQRFSQAMDRVFNSLGQGVRAAQNMIRMLTQSFMSNTNIADKLATLLGDSKKLLDDILHHNVENLKSLLARFQFAERLAQVGQLMEKALKSLASEAAQWIQEAAERTQRALDRIKRWFKAGSRQSKRPFQNNKQ
jgi:hypothetical protein